MKRSTIETLHSIACNVNAVCEYILIPVCYAGLIIVSSVLGLLVASLYVEIPFIGADLTRVSIISGIVCTSCALAVRIIGLLADYLEFELWWKLTEPNN